MKLLFNEQFGTSTFYWYQLNVSNVEELNKQLEAIINTCHGNKDKEEVQFYFYTQEVHQDAIGDRVRTTLMIRRVNDVYEYNLNVADSVMATKAETIMRLKNALDDLL